MSPHYDRNFGATQELPVNGQGGAAADGDAIDSAAEALREVELESAQPAKPSLYAGHDNLDAMSIDELRDFAASLNVPHLAQFVSKQKLLAAIRGRE